MGRYVTHAVTLVLEHRASVRILEGLPTVILAILPSSRRVASFSSICRTYINGGTRIRTGDSMIFSHFRRPIGMRKTRVGKWIFVHEVPSDTSWFCPTVDTACVALRGAGTRTHTSAP